MTAVAAANGLDGLKFSLLARCVAFLIAKYSCDLRLFNSSCDFALRFYASRLAFEFFSDRVVGSKSKSSRERLPIQYHTLIHSSTNNITEPNTMIASVRTSDKSIRNPKMLTKTPGVLLFSTGVGVPVPRVRVLVTKTGLTIENAVVTDV